jgi:hypothetical protein
VDALGADEDRVIRDVAAVTAPDRAQVAPLQRMNISGL